jgi:hypothetical protein
MARFEREDFERKNKSKQYKNPKPEAELSLIGAIHKVGIGRPARPGTKEWDETPRCLLIEVTATGKNDLAMTVAIDNVEDVDELIKALIEARNIIWPHEEIS